MELYIAGGCGEYGRTCFLVKGETISFLVDCGSIPIDGAEEPPRLSQEQIDSIDCVFLTHSHSGHAGGLPWLLEHGYTGPVIATEATFSQLPFSLENTVLLEEICPGRFGTYRNISIDWGRSGHCRGSVWYQFTLEGKSIFFSGDYADISIVYAGDQIRSRTADFAVLDCGPSYFRSQEDCSFNELVERVVELFKKHQLFLFPVPQYGYGAEMLRWLHRNMPEVPCYVGELFMSQLQLTDDRFWHKSPPGRMLNVATTFTGDETYGFYFVGDPHLARPESRKLVDHVLSHDGIVVMTSPEPPQDYCTDLLNSGKAYRFVYPVHFDDSHYKMLMESNNFKKAIPYHTPDSTCPDTFTF